MSTPHYSNARRIEAAGYQIFGEDLGTPIADTNYSHNLTESPGSVWDFSGCALCRDQSGSLRTSWTGALITPRHLLVAHHILADITIGMDYYFKTPGGTEVVREVTAKSGNLGSDLALLTLDSAVTGCAVYPIPTAESLASLVGTTLWCIDIDRTIVCRTVSTQGATIAHVIDGSGTSLVSGDSAQPAFTTRGTELVLLGTHHFTTSFPSAGYYLAALQAFCDDTSQTITTVSVDPADWAEPLAAQLEDAYA